MSDIAQSIPAQLAANATDNPDGVWLTSPDSGDTVSWREAADRARAIACQLDALGLAPGAPVAVAAQNSIWATLAFMGITTGGYLATPLNLVSGARVLSYVIGIPAYPSFCARMNSAPWLMRPLPKSARHQGNPP